MTTPIEIEKRILKKWFIENFSDISSMVDFALPDGLSVENFFEDFWKRNYIYKTFEKYNKGKKFQGILKSIQYLYPPHDH